MARIKQWNRGTFVQGDNIPQETITIDGDWDAAEAVVSQLTDIKNNIQYLHTIAHNGNDFTMDGIDSDNTTFMPPGAYLIYIKVKIDGEFETIAIGKLFLKQFTEVVRPPCGKPAIIRHPPTHQYHHKTIKGIWTPKIVDDVVDWNDVPSNARNNAFEIRLPAQKYHDEYDAEINNGDIIFFGDDGAILRIIPKTFMSGGGNGTGELGNDVVKTWHIADGQITYNKLSPVVRDMIDSAIKKSDIGDGLVFENNKLTLSAETKISLNKADTALQEHQDLNDYLKRDELNLEGTLDFDVIGGRIF